MNAKSASIALLVLVCMTGPSLASDHFTAPLAAGHQRVTLADLGAAGSAVGNSVYKAPYGVSSLMCSPSGFGHVSTCVPKTFANRHQLVEVSSR